MIILLDEAGESYRTIASESLQDNDISFSKSIVQATLDNKKTLISSDYQNGFNAVDWDGLDDAGNTVSSGVYFYRLKAGNQIVTRRMILVH